MSDQITINITPDQNVSINPITLNQGLINHSVTHQSGGSDELLHNLLGGLQGGSGGQYYHLSSGEYFNLTTGSVVRPSETGQFYSSSNPSGYTATGYVTGISGYLQNQISISRVDYIIDNYDVLNLTTGRNVSHTISSWLISGPGTKRINLPDSNSFSGDKLYLNVTSPSNITTVIYRPSPGPGYSLAYTIPPNTNFIGSWYLREFVAGLPIWQEFSSIYGFLSSFDAKNIYVNRTENQTITGVKNFVSRPTVNSTGVVLSGEATTQTYVTGISGGLQTQITTLNNQTGSYYPRTNPSGYITGVDLSFSGNYYTKTESESRYVNTTGAETILGNKTFHDNVYINNLYVTGLETIVNTTNTNVASNYITLNLTGGAVDGGVFFVTGSGLTGINDSGAIIGFDHSDKFKFGISTRASDLSTLNTIASVEQMTGISGGLQTQISTLNNQTGSYVLNTQTGNFITTSQTGIFYANSNPSGFITGINNIVYTTGDQTISGIKTFTTGVNISGNVGIGTTTPTEKLDVNGSVSVDPSSGTYTLQNKNTSALQSAFERARGWLVWFFGSYTGRLKTADITDNREWTLPDESGTVALARNTGRTIFVDNVTGNDTRGTLSQYSISTPFKTIGAAMAASAIGDTVRVRAGSYTISSTINLNNEGNLHLEEGAVVTCNVAVLGVGAPVFTLSLNQAKVISGGGQFVIEGLTTKFWQQTGGTTTNQLCSIECYSILQTSTAPIRIFEVTTGVLVVQTGTVYAPTSTIAYCEGTSSNVNYRVPFTYCARMVDMPTSGSTAQFSCVCQTIQCFGSICFLVVGGGLGIDYETLVDAAGICTFFSFEYGNDATPNGTTIRGGRAITYSLNPCISFPTTTGTSKVLRLYGDPFFFTNGTNSITAASARTVLSSYASSNKPVRTPNVTLIGNYFVNAALG